MLQIQLLMIMVQNLNGEWQTDLKDLDFQEIKKSFHDRMTEGYLYFLVV